MGCGQADETVVLILARTGHRVCNCWELMVVKFRIIKALF
jgi:hypothetical protein